MGVDGDVVGIVVGEGWDGGVGDWFVGGVSDFVGECVDFGVDGWVVCGDWDECDGDEEKEVGVSLRVLIYGVDFFCGCVVGGVCFFGCEWV